MDLPRGLDALKDTEVANDPTGQKTQSQVPSHTSQFFNPCGQAQHSPSDRRDVQNVCCYIFEYRQEKTPEVNLPMYWQTLLSISYLQLMSANLLKELGGSRADVFLHG